MSAPPAIESCPLTAAKRPLEDVAPGGKLGLGQLKALTAQALQLYRSSNTWPSSKTFQLEHDSKVVATKGLSSQSGRLAKTAWHARRSEHSPSQVHKMGYADFYEGLAVDHPIKERQYVEDIIRYERVDGDASTLTIPTLVGDASSKYISAVRADVWTTEYKLPMLVGNRDFVELFLTVEFKPHKDPLSSSHIEEMLSALTASSSSSSSSSTGKGGEEAQKTGVTDETKDSTSSGLRRSCLNIQLPVETPACGVKKDFVRASYGSVEVLKELEEDGTEWWMTVQSDSAGSIPLIFQEMAMPSKVAPDVPLFIGWAVKQKQA